jgi:kynurenine formamidase
MRIVDLSVPLDNDKAWAPRAMRTRVTRQGHRFGRLAIWFLFRLTPRYLRGGLGWANDTIALSTHGTTHVDAPWHYGPTSEGRPARTIDQLPLDWFYGDGVVLDCRHRVHGEAIEIADLEAALAQIGYHLKAGDIVLIRTDGDRRLGTPDYFTHGAGVSAAGTRWLIDQGVKLMGIDAWGWDVALPVQARLAKATGRADIFWAAHYVGIDREYCQIERLTNLGALPSVGFKVCAFPLKVVGGSAGPARVVALVDEEAAPDSP